MKMWDPTAVTITEPASQSGAGKYLPIGEKIDQGNKKGETMLTNNFCWCQGRMRPFVVSESRNGYLKVLRAFQECTITFHSFEINQKMGQNGRDSKWKCLLPKWVQTSFLYRAFQEWAWISFCLPGSPDWNKGYHSQVQVHCKNDRLGQAPVSPRSSW